jgi:hypothetical protein
MTEYLTMSENLEIRRWNSWQDSWEHEYEAGIIDIVSISPVMIYLGEGDWQKIPIETGNKVAL